MAGREMDMNLMLQTRFCLKDTSGGEDIFELINAALHVAYLEKPKEFLRRKPQIIQALMLANGQDRQDPHGFLVHAAAGGRIMEQDQRIIRRNNKNNQPPPPEIVVGLPATTMKSGDVKCKNNAKGNAKLDKSSSARERALQASRRLRKKRFSQFTNVHSCKIH